MKVIKENPDWRTDTNDKMSNSFRQLMLDNIELENEPSLGIFWYDVYNTELFGVSSTLAQDVPFQESSLFNKPVKTTRRLHYQIWNKEKNKGKDKRFQGDYTKVPRGRIFEVKDDGFIVCVGKWIDNYPNCKNLILNEFDLPEDTKFKIDSHWDLGHGWSNELL